MSNPQLSVITTVYNCEQYINYSIESILNQTFSDFEFIIMNDGSTDNTVDIIKSYQDPRIRFFDDDKNIKIPSRRNQAIKHANSSYLVIHDGDDISLPTRLEKSYNFLSDNPDIFCVGSHAQKIDLKGEELGYMDYPPETHKECLDMVTKKCMNPMIDPTTTFKKEVFDRLGSYTLDKEIYTVPDFDIWLKAMSSGYRFANIQEPLIQYRENPDGMTQSRKQEMINAHMVIWTKFMRDRYRLSQEQVSRMTKTVSKDSRSRESN